MINMKIKKLLFGVGIFALVLGAVGLLTPVGTVSAQAQVLRESGTSGTNDGGGSSNTADGGLNCAILPPEMCAAANEKDTENSGAWLILVYVLNILTAGVAVVALAGVVYGSVMYASSAGNPEQTKKAMGIIQNVVIGILAYAVMYSLLQWLIPGGVFN